MDAGTVIVLIVVGAVVFKLAMWAKRQVKPTHETDSSAVVVEPMATDNPWLQRVQELPAFGLVPNGRQDMLGRVSPDPEEEFRQAKERLLG